MFAEPERLLLGLMIGLIFGFLLQKGRVAKYPVIIGQFLFKDWTVVKIMGTAVVVGSIGVYALVRMGVASLHLKPAELGAVLMGGLLFGTGMAIFGYCPGTGVAGVGEGHKDALSGLLGMLSGAATYIVFYPTVTSLVELFPNWGKVTLADVTGTSPWLWIVGLTLALVAGYWVSSHARTSQSDNRSRRHKTAKLGVKLA